MDTTKLLIVIFSLFAGLLTIYIYYWNNLLGRIYIILSILVLFSIILFDCFISDDFSEKYPFNINGLTLIVSIGLAIVFTVLMVIVTKFYCPFGFVLTIPYVKLRLLLLRLYINFKLPIFLAIFFLISFFDEYLFRGVIYTNIREEYGSSLAIVIESILYGLYILPVAMLYFSYVSLIVLFVASVVFAMIMTFEREKLETLLGPILTHFIFLVLFFIILG